MIVVAGENLVDLVRQADGAYFPVPGGAPFNVARALGRQGIPTGYLNPLSSDGFGHLLRQTLEAAGTHVLSAPAAAPTSLAVVATNERGEASYSFYRSGVADRATTGAALCAAIPASAVALHTGGLALVPPDTIHVIEAMTTMRNRGCFCTLDVNARPAVVKSLGVSPADYRAAVLAAVALADIVKVSDEDLLHLGFAGAPDDAARSLLAHGPALVVLTLGPRGAVALASGRRVVQPAFEAHVVDSVGAGDCFFAGFLAWLYRNGQLKAAAAGTCDDAAIAAALRHATACAAIDLGRRGCDPATWEEAKAAAAGQ